MLARCALGSAQQLPLLQSAWLGAAPSWLCSAGSAFATQQQPLQQQQQLVQPRGPAAYAESFLSPPHSLKFARGGVHYPAQLEGNALGRAFLAAIGAYSRRQTLRNGASVLYAAIQEAAEDEQLQQALGLDPARFMTSHTLLSLHVWLVIHRLAAEGDSRDAALFRQSLYSDFFVKDVERRVHAHGVTMHLSKWLKKLEQVFYGSCQAYDRALLSGDGEPGGGRAGLAAALVKNVYEGDEGRRGWAELAARYLARELRCLQETEVDQVYSGQIRFSRDVVVK